jgi:hypothetical protein
LNPLTIYRSFSSYPRLLVISRALTYVAGNLELDLTPEENGDPDEIIRATPYECIGQGFAIVGMPIAEPVRTLAAPDRDMPIWIDLASQGVAHLWIPPVVTLESTFTCKQRRQDASVNQLEMWNKISEGSFQGRF